MQIQEDLKKGADRWEPSDPAAWKVIDIKDGKAYSQFKQSNYKPPHRSPFNYSLLKDVQVGDFVLDAKVQSTAKDYPHRDMCLFLGYQDKAHFYYAHLGKKMDDHCNQIFIVDGTDRKKISTKTTPGTNWTNDWHQVRLVRKVSDGTIEVYFDDMKTPVMSATDKTFAWGRVGIGSFDDTGNWTDIKLSGVKAEGKGQTKPEKGVKAVSLPGDEVSIRRDGVELTRLHFAQKLPRPFLFPVIGPSGHPLTRKSGDGGHPHHNSLWLGHQTINDVDFWTNDGKGRVIHKKLESLTDGESSASVTTLNHWVDSAKDKTLLTERRRYTVQALDKGEWQLIVDSQFEAATDVTFGKTSEGFLGVQFVKTISIRADATYLSGSSLTSNGGIDEDGVLAKPAKWVDFTGPVTEDAEAPVAGIAIFDHPKNPKHPSLFQVRDSGWMCTSISASGPVELPKGKTLRLRYGVYVHGNQPAAALDASWQAFAKCDLDELAIPK